MILTGYVNKHVVIPFLKVDPRAKIFVGNLDWKTPEGAAVTVIVLFHLMKSISKSFLPSLFVCVYLMANDRGYSFERNCVLRRWESETLK